MSKEVAVLRGSNPRPGRYAVLAVFLVLLAHPVRAEKADSSWGELGGDLGMGMLGSDVFTTVQLGVDIQEGDINVGLQAALRIRTVDLKDENGTTLRREDWDEPSDYAHIVRYLSYRKKLGSVSVGLSLGELSPATVGHGTLVGDYYSVVDLDHPHSGLRARVRHRLIQVDFVADDYVRPEILTARVGVRPFPFLPKLEVGLSGLLDIKAPVAARVDEEGQRIVSDTRNLAVHTDILGAVGFDVAYTFFEKDDFWVRPFADNNWFVDHGGGLHLGVEVGGRPFGGPVRLRGSAEYRLRWNGYLPGYVDAFYDVQRFQLRLGRLENGAGVESRDVTKLTALEGLDRWGHGGRWALQMEYEKIFWARASYALRDGVAGDGVLLEIGVPYGRRWVFSALGAKTGIIDDADWKVGDGYLSGAELRVRLLKNLYLLSQFRYLYAINSDGYYRGVLFFNIAAGGSWGY